MKLKPSTSQRKYFQEIFRKSSHHVNTNKGSVVKQSGTDVKGCRSQKVLCQPNMRVFLQYSVSQFDNKKPEELESEFDHFDLDNLHPSSAYHGFRFRV